MEEKKDTLGMLDLVIRPGFCVKENQIIKVNQAAESLFITPGTDVRPLLLTAAEVRRVHRRVSVSDAEPVLPQLRRVGHTGGRH